MKYQCAWAQFDAALHDQLTDTIGYAVQAVVMAECDVVPPLFVPIWLVVGEAVQAPFYKTALRVVSGEFKND